MISIPFEVQLAATALQVYGLWRAGDGWRFGWLINCIQAVGWITFAVATRQWVLATGPVLTGSVDVRNYLVARRRAFAAIASVSSSQ